jgi:hypothetical protein
VRQIFTRTALAIGLIVSPQITDQQSNSTTKSSLSHSGGCACGKICRGSIHCHMSACAREHGKSAEAIYLDIRSKVLDLKDSALGHLRPSPSTTHSQVIGLHTK